MPQSTLDAHLTVIQGDVHDLQSVSRTLTSRNDRPTDLIVSGIGLPPVFRPNPLSPVTLANPTICQDAIGNILTALRGSPLPPREKPLLVALSSTGISSRRRDLPVAMVPFYHYLGAVPHKDKKVMEDVIVAEMAKPAGERAIENFVIIRPSLLTDGKRLGMEKVRVGEESEEAVKPAVGYTISREDVGGWIFEELVNGDGAKRFAGKMVSLTN